MGAIFITGTDTGVGKTVICGLLAKYFNDKGSSVITQKWIQSGTKENELDILTHLKLMGKDKKEIKKYLPYMMPYSFKYPASPHLTASLEGKKINPEKIKKSFYLLEKYFDQVIVEGVGGALVPYNNKRLVIDIAKELKLPVIVVVGNKLGAINHTLLTIEALEQRKTKILGLIFNNLSNNNDLILKDNIKIIKRLTNLPVLAALPWIKNTKLLYEEFKKIGKII